MKAFMFPGQGSQKKGMGAPLFESVPEFLEAESEIDEILGYSLRQLCLEDPHQRLSSTQYTQPCLYVVNALHYFKAKAEGQVPDMLAGHSLGEYNALLAAGAFDFLTGLRLVARRGELMAQARNGLMAAILGMDIGKLAATLESHGFTDIDVANFNAPSQTVISGPVEDIRRACGVLDTEGAGMCVPLAVSAAFHSRYMAPAAQAFAAFLRDFSFKPLHTPVMANVTGMFYPQGEPAATVSAMLVKQIHQPVLWTHSIRRLVDAGVREFVELGPGTVLTRLVQQIQKA